MHEWIKNTRQMNLANNLKELLTIASHNYKIEQGSYLFQEGMPANEIYIIHSGIILISKLSADGRELALRMSSTGDIVGELILFTSDDAKYFFNAKAIEATEVAVIPKQVLESKLLNHAPLAYEFMKWMNDHFRKTQTKFKDLVMHGKKGALYSTLIRMTNSYGIPCKDGILIDLAFTNQDLATFSASTREGVNRLLSDLKKSGVISYLKGKLVIHDLDFLRKEIDCENCPPQFCRID